MLSPETPFPQVGSYALLIDEGQPLGQQRAELVRIMTRGSTGNLHTLPTDSSVTVAFPLRTGASGTKTVPAADLIDATPLTGKEAREMVDLGRELRGARVRDRKAKEARHDALDQRALWAPHMLRLIDKAQRLQRARAA